MKKTSILVFTLILLSIMAYGNTQRPCHTYSIVAYDKENQQMGVAVQSHWFSVGSVVSWAEPGVGVVATQSFVEVSYGPLGLELMRADKTAPQALKALLSVDKHQNVRQVAMVDTNGNVAVHTGKTCIPEAGHSKGKFFSCQANMMENGTVWQAMADTYQKSKGPLVDRLMAALEAAQNHGGDIRGKQSAAILVVSTKPSKVPWKNRLFDLRIEDHRQPLQELKRLIKIAKAYNHMNKGDEYLTVNNIDGAMKEYTTAMKIYSGNPEMIFWPAVTLASNGKVQQSLPLFKKVFKVDRRWIKLLKRLPAVNQFPRDAELMEKILSVAPKKKNK